MLGQCHSLTELLCYVEDDRGNYIEIYCNYVINNNNFS